jgi:3-oxoacyl-[acyl-carrier protein] reductase
MILQGKVAIVTGASKGIGAAIAAALGAAGAAVVVNYATARESAEAVVDTIVGQAGRAMAVQGDMAQAEDVRQLFAAAHQAYGRLDILINNAGVYQFEPLEQVTEAEFHREFNLNVLGPILAIQEAVKQFGDEGGNIVNVSSVASTNPALDALVYTATKAALDGVTMQLARQLGPRKIRVNSVLPGPIDTEGVRRVGMVGTEVEQRLLANTPMGRIGLPDDVAKVVLFLVSDAAGWVTGQKLGIDGGFRP